MKKLLSTIMALVMLLSLVPMAVAEEGETAKWSETKSEKHVAQVGDMFYETLADAVASVPVDGTETTITLLNNAEVENYIAINGGKNIVLDLNGHDVVHNGNYLFDVYNAKFHVTGEGTLFENVKDGYAPIIARGSATDTADYTVITIDKGVTLKGDYTGIFVAKDAGNGYHNYGLVINMFGTIDMGAVADGYHYSGMYVNGTNTVSDGNVMTINLGGATIKNCEATGIYAAGYAKWNITNSSITSGNTGIEIRAGELTVNGATVVGNGVPTVVTPNGNGSTTEGAGIAVAQHTTKLPIKVTINSSDISGYSALYQSNPQNNDAESVKKVSVAVNGGTFKTINRGTCGVYSENNCVTISGGAFNVAPDAKYLAEGMIVVPGVKDAPYSVQPAKRTNEEENTETEVKVDGDNVTVTVTDKTTGTTTETVTDTKTGAKTETKTENKVEGNVTTKTETVTEKNAADETTKATETVTTVKTENGGKTTVVTKKDTLNKTETTEVTGVTAPTTASDVTLDVKNTTNVAVNKASMTALKGDNVKDVVIETKDAKLTLNKDAVKTMEGNVPANSKMTLNVTVTEEKNATTTEIEKVKVEVTAKNEAGQNVFPENTANTNGKITITIPYTRNAKYLDLWYIAANDSATYMGRFPVVNGFVSFDVKHFSQYDLIPVASSGSSVIKTGAGSSAASTTQTVTTDLTPGSITKVTVDGKVVDAKYYTVSGSNVTFTAEFLKTLKNGSHTVTVENATKIAKGVFTVNNPTTAQSPTTADAGIALYAGMAIASVMGTGVVFTSRKRKNH